jgi:hypothetical protein
MRNGIAGYSRGSEGDQNGIQTVLMVSCAVSMSLSGQNVRLLLCKQVKHPRLTEGGFTDPKMNLRWNMLANAHQHLPTISENTNTAPKAAYGQFKSTEHLRTEHTKTSATHTGSKTSDLDMRVGKSTLAITTSSSQRFRQQYET